VRSDTRAIVINTPHNPTGFHMDRLMLDEVVALAERHGCLLLSDEVYRESEHCVADTLPAACDLSHCAASIGVMSKTYGLPGLRIGWIASHDAALLARMAQLKDYTTICSAAPSEFLAGVALRQRETLVARTRRLLISNVSAMDSFMADHAAWFDWKPPRAGPVAFPRLLGRAAEMGDDVFCETLAREAGVLLLPGSVYELSGHVRIGFGRADLPVALQRLEYTLKRWL
jgi:aspartate/methionine/tyrosine aminotransferase